MKLPKEVKSYAISIAVDKIIKAIFSFFQKEEIIYKEN